MKIILRYLVSLLMRIIIIDTILFMVIYIINVGINVYNAMDNTTSSINNINIFIFTFCGGLLFLKICNVIKGGK